MLAGRFANLQVGAVPGVSPLLTDSVAAPMTQPAPYEWLLSTQATRPESSSGWLARLEAEPGAIEAPMGTFR